MGDRQGELELHVLIFLSIISAMRLFRMCTPTNPISSWLLSHTCERSTTATDFWSFEMYTPTNATSSLLLFHTFERTTTLLTFDL